MEENERVCEKTLLRRRVIVGLAVPRRAGLPAVVSLRARRFAGGSETRPYWQTRMSAPPLQAGVRRADERDYTAHRRRVGILPASVGEGRPPCRQK